MTRPSECRPGARCKNWRECEYCSKIRQARISDIAEHGAHQSRIITYAVVRTSSEVNLKKDKSRLLTWLRAITNGGIWTVEAGEINGLHVNFLTGAERYIDAAEIATRWPSSSDVWAERVPHSEVRNVAAYISKRSGIPAKHQFQGQIYGSWGTWRTPLQALSSKAAGQIAPIAQALAINHQIEKETGAHLNPPKLDQKDRLTTARYYLKHMFAALEGDIDTDGLVYHEHVGVVRLKRPNN